MMVNSSLQCRQREQSPLNSDGKQFHQYQQNKQPQLNSDDKQFQQNKQSL